VSIPFQLLARFTGLNCSDKSCYMLNPRAYSYNIILRRAATKYHPIQKILLLFIIHRYRNDLTGNCILRHTEYLILLHPTTSRHHLSITDMRH